MSGTKVLTSPKSFFKSMPFSTKAPAYLFRPGGLIDHEVDSWCRSELRGEWVAVYSFGSDNHRVDFQHEVDLVHFKLRWVNGY